MNLTAIKYTALIAAMSFSLNLVDGAQAKAEEAAPCAVLQKFSGDIQVLDESRTPFKDPKPSLAIPCGGWVSVNFGHATLKHRDGFEIQLTTGTFMGLANAEGSDLGPVDPIVLYRGQILAEAKGLDGVLRMTTPNARARMTSGSAVLIYNDADEETQWIALDQRSSLENRFDPRHPVSIKPGELTRINLKLLRVLPSAPRAVSHAHLKEFLSRFDLNEPTRTAWLKTASNRQNRKLASLESPHEPPAGKTEDYLRHRPSKKDPLLQKHLLNRIVSGQSQSTDLIYPKYRTQDRESVRVSDDQTAQGGKGHHPLRWNSKAEEAEKRRLIEELHKVDLQ